MKWPAFLLALGVIRHVPYEHVSPALRGQAFHALGALVMSCLVLSIWREHRSKSVALVASWWLYEEILVMTCSAWRVIDWWPIPLGEDQCTAMTGYRLGAASLVAIGWISATVLKAKNE